MDVLTEAERNADEKAGARTRAVWFAGPDMVEVREEIVRSPVGREISVRALASGISQGTELLVLRGQAPGDLDLDLHTLEGSFNFPIKFGYSSVGRVIACGPDARAVSQGDLVFVHHPHQTEFVINEELAVPLTSDTSPEVGTLLANLETAVNVLLDAHPRLGERVVVFGQGVVGLLIAMLLQRVGVGAVIAVEPSETRASVSLSVGVEQVLAPEADVVEQVLKWTDGVGADMVIEASGAGSALNQGIECLAFEGTLVAVSWYGTKPVNLNLGGSFHRKRLRIVSSQVGSIAPAIARRWTRERRLRLAVSLLGELDLASLISHRIPFDHAGTAYRQLQTDSSEVVHMVLTYGDDCV
jgi:2-desacetyl-2-hydroxyethyl bacteriochlorophyllide A dehydrogenase